MRNKLSFILLFLICGVYYVTFIATKPAPVCDSDCEKVNATGAQLYLHREGYVQGVYRCTYQRVSDTLCVIVKDTTGINWDRLADTACMTAAANGLRQQFVLILTNRRGVPLDTLARLRCP